MNPENLPLELATRINDTTEVFTVTAVHGYFKDERDEMEITL